MGNQCGIPFSAAAAINDLLDNYAGIQFGQKVLRVPLTVGVPINITGSCDNS